MITLSIKQASLARSVKNAACYHLVTIKSAFPVQFFAATQPQLDCGLRYIVLDLFS
jgi:hypothetical protein